jgi:hypothetical protein
MDEVDEIALQKMNLHLPNELKPCTEDRFEEVMGFFEQATRDKQPFAAVDNPPVLPLEELEEQFDETVGTAVRRLAKFVYEHWKLRRLESANHGLQPNLKVSTANLSRSPSLTITKLETGQDTDDADPYVCFRRREIRQIRKTRHRDAQSAEKLRRLRKELEDARHIMAMVKQREMMRKEVLSIDRMLFKQRADVKETKRKLGIKGDDEDLINQKVSHTRLGVSSKLTFVTAKEKDCGQSWSRTLTTDPIPHVWSWRAGRRHAIVGRLAGREGESNPKRNSTECGETHQMERRICGQNESTTYPSIPEELYIELRLSTSHACDRVPTNPSCICGF